MELNGAMTRPVKNSIAPKVRPRAGQNGVEFRSRAVRGAASSTTDVQRSRPRRGLGRFERKRSRRGFAELLFRNPFIMLEQSAASLAATDFAEWDGCRIGGGGILRHWRSDEQFVLAP
jgi:hypothetical protein